MMTTSSPRRGLGSASISARSILFSNTLLLAVAIVAGLVPPPVAADIMPTARRTTWNPGIPGGIPARNTVCTTVNASTYGNGTHRRHGGIQSAINACPDGQVVQLSAGDFLINGSQPISISKSITVRGTGPGRPSCGRRARSPTPSSSSASGG